MEKGVVSPLSVPPGTTNRFAQPRPGIEARIWPASSSDHAELNACARKRAVVLLHTKRRYSVGRTAAYCSDAFPDGVAERDDAGAKSIASSRRLPVVDRLKVVSLVG